MAKAVYIDKSGKFFKKNRSFVDFALGHMSLGIETALKMKSGMPVDKGQMKAATRSWRHDNGHFRVRVNKEYAAYQERGMRRDGTHVVRNYTTGGTSAGFFDRAIKMIMSRREEYIQQARKAVGL